MNAIATTRVSTASGSIRKVAIASFTGTAIEWYDFFLYNAATSVVFPRLFFPSGDNLAGMLQAYVTYAVGFVARPIGGIVCGHFGDRIGRKSMLVFTLLITGVATFLIGLLPPYSDIGIWAPILLVVLRFTQGFGIGGEWGGAVLMAVEHAPDNRRGFYGSWPQVGVPVGLFLANIVFYGLIANLPESAAGTPASEPLSEWWRAPFLFSILLVGVGLYIRLSVAETPMFSAIKPTRSKRPILDVWRKSRRDLFLVMGARMAENGVFYLYTFFITTFAMRRGFSQASVFKAIWLAALLIIVALPIYGGLSDRVGRRRVYLFGAIFTGLFAFPFFWLVETQQPGLMTLGIVCALVLGWAAMYAPQASFFSELFGTRIRYSGASLGTQVASIFAGGLMQIVALNLLNWTGSYWPIALIVVGMATVTTVSVLMASETARKDIAAESQDYAQK